MSVSCYLVETELEAEDIILRPLRFDDKPALLAAAADGDLNQLWYTSVPNASTVEQYLEAALNDQLRGLALPFAVIHKASGKLIGTTRYCNADAVNRRLEIGYTWYAKSYQRTAVNTQAKLLLLSHAFEQLHSIAVEFRTHWHNHASRAAIARLGAKQDGILRQHSVDAHGRFRDTVVFSIIHSEWPTVKQALEYKLLR